MTPERFEEIRATFTRGKYPRGVDVLGECIVEIDRLRARAADERGGQCGATCEARAEIARLRAASAAVVTAWDEDDIGRVDGELIEALRGARGPR